MKTILFVLFGAMLLFTTACSKGDDSTPDFDENNLAPLTIEFDNIVGDRTLSLGAATPYTNAAGERFTISQVQYFISNVKVAQADGSTYTVQQDSSYFLIKGADRTTRFARVRVPEGDYTRLTFTLGVDSLRSTMDISRRTGVLDPGGQTHDGMYWGWNAGYIFFKMEGNSEVISNDMNGDPTGKQQFRYHIGGFGGYSAPTINNIKVIFIDLAAGGIPRVRKERHTNVHLFVDLMKAFNGKNRVSIAAHPTVMFSEYSSAVSANLAEMFRHDHTEN
jgi:hypothetical protein